MHVLRRLSIGASVLLLLIIGGQSVWARGIDPFNRAFITLRGGAVGYMASNIPAADRYDGQAALSVGRWMLSPIGIQARFTEAHSSNRYGIASFYEMFDVDLLYNPVAHFRHQSQSYPWNYALGLGVGVVHRKENFQQEADNDFFGVLSFSVERQISGSFFAEAELRSVIFPSQFDGNESLSAMIMASLGVSYYIQYNPFARSSSGESQRMREDWYIGGGLLAGAWPLGNEGVLGALDAGAQLVLGKHLSTVWEGRLSAATEYVMVNNTFLCSSLLLDMMCNLNNVISEKRNRPWNVSLFAGAGIRNNSVASSEKFLWCTTGGLSVRRWLSIKSDLVFDVRGVVVPPRFSSTASPVELSFAATYVYNIGRNTCR